MAQRVAVHQEGTQSQQRIQLTSLRSGLETIGLSVRIRPNGKVWNARAEVLLHLGTSDVPLFPRYGHPDTTEGSEREIRELASIRRGLVRIVRSSPDKGTLVAAADTLNVAIFNEIANLKRTSRFGIVYSADMESVMVRDAKRAVQERKIREYAASRIASEDQCHC